MLTSNFEWVDLRVASYQWTSPLVLVVEGRMRCYLDINLMIHEKFFESILGQMYGIWGRWPWNWH